MYIPQSRNMSWVIIVPLSLKLRDVTTVSIYQGSIQCNKVLQNLNMSESTYTCIIHFYMIVGTDGILYIDMLVVPDDV